MSPPPLPSPACGGDVKGRRVQNSVMTLRSVARLVARGVSAFPAAVTAQMVANFSAGGAAINQLSRVADAHLRVIPLALERPTADFTQAPAMTEGEFLAAVATGHDAVSPEAHLVCL